LNTTNAVSGVNRIILIVLDSVGIGALPDAAKYGDEGANTLQHIAKGVGGLKLPNLENLGLGKISPLKGMDDRITAQGVFGKMAEASVGKDTTTGHWEIAGIILKEPFPTYPDGFPEEIIEQFKQEIGRDILGNKPASGTKILEELGEEHLQTGKPIVYTSADSVFQIAAHEEVIPVTELYEMCKIARKLLTGKHAVGRVIARPFVGKPGSFTRTGRREDFSLTPPEDTMLDKIVNGEKTVLAVGKIIDIFAGKGISESNHTISNLECIDVTLEYMKLNQSGLIFTNLVEFDMVYGHRRDVEGYYQALKDFDTRLPDIISRLREDDILVITADHGCDPTHKGTDHTREYVPLLIYGKKVKRDYNLQVRSTFADLAQTITELLGVEGVENGTSFAKEIII
jgi:phosphopentomutase